MNGETSMREMVTVGLDYLKEHRTLLEQDIGLSAEEIDEAFDLVEFVLNDPLASQTMPQSIQMVRAFVLETCGLVMLVKRNKVLH